MKCVKFEISCVAEMLLTDCREDRLTRELKSRFAVIFQIGLVHCTHSIDPHESGTHDCKESSVFFIKLVKLDRQSPNKKAYYFTITVFPVIFLNYSIYFNFSDVITVFN